MDGRLSVQFEKSAHCSCTVARFLEQEPPWKVVRAFPNETGGALIHLNNVSGGILAGDRLELQIQVAAGATAQVTSTGATRIYRGRPGVPAASCTTAISLAENSLLEFLPDALIPFADSAFEQQTSIQLDHGATLFWWEVIAPGRLAAGEGFQYRSLRLRSDICVEGIPIAMERYHLEPALRALDSPARRGADRYLITFYICQAGHGDWRGVEQELAGIAARRTQPGEGRWAVSALTQHGVVIRGLTREARWAWPGLQEFWRAAKLRLLHQEAIPPRKVY